MKSFFPTLLFCLFTSLLFAQDADTTEERKLAPKAFVNCQDCDQQYLKNEINYLNFVRDRRLADVVILIRNINAGNGGTEYTLELTGENNYKGVEHTEKFNSTPNMSDSDIRTGIKEALHRGSLPFY